jgi:hypothetical protein
VKIKATIALLGNEGHIGSRVRLRVRSAATNWIIIQFIPAKVANKINWIMWHGVTEL